MIHVEYSDYFISKLHFPTDLTPLRTVSQYEIEFFKTDTGTAFLNGVSYPHKKGGILIARPGDTRRTKNNFECHSVKFSIDENDFILPYLNNIAGVKNIIGSSKIESVYNDIHSEFVRILAGRELYLDAKVRELISLICMAESSTNNHIKYRQHYDAVYACTEFLNKNYRQSPTLSSLAKTANMSPTFFHTVFKSIIGKTPYEYLIERRIQNASVMLENSSLSIDEIAERCGFSSRQYFDAVFKKHMGKTPAKYRKSALCQ